MDVVTRPRIISSEIAQHTLPEGLSIEGMLTATQWDRSLDAFTVVTVEGVEIERDLWAYTKPREGKRVLIALRPAGGGGGGGKQIIMAVAAIAIMVAAWYVAPYIAAAIWTTVPAWGTAAVAAGVSAAAGLAMSAFIKPPGLPSLSGNVSLGNRPEESQTYGVSGANNQVRRYSVVPRIYGRHRFTPAMAAEPYVLSAGSTQTIYMLLDFGYGPVAVSDIRIGSSPISNFKTARTRIYQSFVSGDALSIYANDHSTLTVNAALSQNIDNDRVMPQQGSTAFIDLSFPGGLIEVTKSGDNRERNERVDIYVSSSANPGNWLPISLFPHRAYFSAEGTGNEGTSGRVQLDAGYARIFDPPFNNPRNWIRGSQNLGVNKVQVGDFVDIPGAGTYTITQLPYVESNVSGAGAPYTRITLDRIVYGGKSGGVVLWGYRSVSSPDRTVTANFGPEQAQVQFSGKTRRPVNISIEINLPNVDSWNVRLVRRTAVSTDPLISNNISWTTLRSVKPGSPIAPRQPRTIMELAISANEEISGNIENINALVTSILYDPRTGEEEVTRNPALIYLDLLTGTANPRAVSRDKVDLEKIKQWADWCDSPRLDDPTRATADLVVDYRITTGELAQTIASAGRALPSVMDGKYTVIMEDETRVPVQMFTNRNAGSIEATRAWLDVPHALKVKYVSENTWQREETIVYADGYDDQTATKFDTLDLIGITRPAQAWRTGRYFLAALALRRERMTVTADIENIVCQRGDLVRVAHDALTANVVGRVREVIGADLVLDIDAVLDMGATPGAQLRKQSGGVLAPVAITAQPGTDRFTIPALTGQAAPGDIIAIGSISTVASDWLVERIAPGPDLSAVLELIEYAPAILDADAGPVPPYVPANGSGISSELPGPSDLKVSWGLFYNDARLPVVEGVLSWAAPLTGGVRFDVERVTPNEPRVVVGQTTGTQFVDTLDPRGWPASGFPVTYYVTAVYSFGGRSQPVPVTVTYYPDTTAPSAVPDFSSNVVGNTTLLFWSLPDAADLDYYQVRFSADPAEIEWQHMTIIAERISANTLSITVPTTDGNYSIRAVDTSGNWGPEAYTRTTIEPLPEVDPVITLEAPVWTGRFVGTELDANGDLVLSKDSNGDYLQEGWWYATAGYTATRKWQAKAYGEITATVIASGDPKGLWNASVQLGALADLPVLSSPWFQPLNHAAPLAGTAQSYFPLGATIATTVDFQVLFWGVKLTSARGDVSPKVSMAKIKLLMDKRAEQGHDLVVPVDGLEVFYRYRFGAVPGLSLTLNDGQPNERLVRTEHREDGFKVEVHNASGHTVGGRHIDYIAIGIGKEVAAPHAQAFGGFNL